MTETIDNKFENSGNLGSSELRELQKLSNDTDKLKNIDHETLKKLKLNLLAEKNSYKQRSKNETSKQWIDWMISKVVNKINSIVDKDAAVSKDTAQASKVAPKVKVSVTKKEVQSQKDTTLEKKEITKTAVSSKEAPDSKALKETQKEKTETAEDAEKTFDKNLEKLLNPNKTLIFKVGDDAMIMDFNNKAQKDKAEKFLSSLETSFQDDKLAAYALIKFLKDNKDNIKSVSDIYKEAWKWLDGNQLVHAEDSSEKELALLDAAKDKDVTVIEADKWNGFVNAVWNTLTLGLYHVDTASVWKETLDDGDYGKKMTSKDLLNWYTKVETDSHWNKTKEVVQEPLWHFEKGTVMLKIAKNMEDILDNDNLLKEDIDKWIKDWNTDMILVKSYLNDHDIKIKSLSAIDLKNKFKEDNTIKNWLESDAAKTVLKDIIPDKWSDAVEITKDGFMHIDEDKLSKTEYVNVKLDGAWEKWKNEEVLMKVNQLKFTDLWVKWVDLSNVPPMVLEDGTMCSFGKEWVYVIGKWLENWVDDIKDYIKEHKTVAAALAWWIIWALLVKWIKMPNINLSFLKDLWKPFEKLWQSIEKWLKSLKVDLPDLNNIFGWYLFTALPMNYKIDWLETKIAELKAKYEWSKSMDAEVDAITWKKINIDMKDTLKYDEAANKLAHYSLVKSSIFNPWEATSLAFEKAERDRDNYKITAISWEIVIGGHTFTLSDWDSLTITVDKKGNVQNMEWNLTEEVTWSDNKIKIANATNVEYTIWHTFWEDEKKETSFDAMRIKYKLKEDKEKDKKVDTKNKEDSDKKLYNAVNDIT